MIASIIDKHNIGSDGILLGDDGCGLVLSDDSISMTTKTKLYGLCKNGHIQIMWEISPYGDGLLYFCPVCNQIMKHNPDMIIGPLFITADPI
jgi:hypothetical protein